MENGDTETEDGLLRWIAGVMGFELHTESEYLSSSCEPGRWWFMSKPFCSYTDESCPGWKITLSFYTQKELLGAVLSSRTAFMGPAGRILHNPFCGMSKDEAALRMAVAGA